MAIKVLKSGLSTTVQDLGRPGYYHIGIPLSGGIDRHALAAAKGVGMRRLTAFRQRQTNPPRRSGISYTPVS
jgi:hypothetical protein